MQKELKLNPIKILGVWTISMIVLTPVFMYISNIGAWGGEQKPLTTLANMIVVTCYGLTILSISTAIIFRKWLKRNWWYVLVILFTTIPAAIEIRDGWLKSSYSFSEMNTEVNGDNIKTKIEYYDNFETKRSTSIWKNGRKDSVWKIFSKQGQILKMQRFNNDTLVENEYSTQ